MSDSDAWYIVLLALCVVLSAFFSSSETAFLSIQRVRLENMIENKVKGSRLVHKLISKPERLISAILLGNNFVNIAATALATTLCVRLWQEHGVIIATVAMTVILLIFAETTPKTFAASHAEKLAIVYAKPLQAITFLLKPLVIGLSWISTSITKIFGGEPVQSTLASPEEIRTMISMGQEEGTVEEAEAEMLHNVFDFGDRPVLEVMIPRLEVVSIEQGSTIADFLALYAESPLSRFPVYQENMDNVVGILSVKDVMMSFAHSQITNESLIDELIRPAYFTPITKPINELFVEMRDGNYRMAVVVDEYGGTAGVVSLTLLVEEIVGPVGDELAAVEKEYEVINEHTFQIDGSMRVEEVNEEMELNLPEGEDYETVAGFVLNLLGHIPKQGEQLRYKGLKIVITHMKGRKIEEVLITKEKHGVKQ